MIIINDATRLLVPLQVDRARPAKKLTTMLIATGKSELHCPKSSAMPALPVKVSSRVFQLLFSGTLYWRFIVKVVLFIRSTKCPFYCAPAKEADTIFIRTNESFIAALERWNCAEETRHGTTSSPGKEEFNEKKFNQTRVGLHFTDHN